MANLSENKNHHIKFFERVIETAAKDNAPKYVHHKKQNTLDALIEKFNKNFPPEYRGLFAKWYFSEKETDMSVRKLRVYVLQQMKENRALLKKFPKPLQNYENFTEVLTAFDNARDLIAYNKYISKLASAPKNILRNADTEMQTKILELFREMDKKEILFIFYSVSSRFRVSDEALKATDSNDPDAMGEKFYSFQEALHGIIDLMNNVLTANTDVKVLERRLSTLDGVTVLFSDNQYILAKISDLDSFKKLSCETTWCIRNVGELYTGKYSNNGKNDFYMLYEIGESGDKLDDFHGIFIERKTGDVKYSYNQTNSNSVSKVTEIIDKMDVIEKHPENRNSEDETPDYDGSFNHYN